MLKGDADHRMARTNLHEAAGLLTPSNELSNIMRRGQLLIDMPWKQGLLSIMELCLTSVRMALACRATLPH